MKLFKGYLFARFENHTNIWANLAHTAIDKVWDSFSRTLIYIKYTAQTAKRGYFEVADFSGTQ